MRNVVFQFSIRSRRCYQWWHIFIIIILQPCCWSICSVICWWWWREIIFIGFIFNKKFRHGCFFVSSMQLKVLMMLTVFTQCGEKRLCLVWINVLWHRGGINIILLQFIIVTFVEIIRTNDLLLSCNHKMRNELYNFIINSINSSSFI